MNNPLLQFPFRRLSALSVLLLLLQGVCAQNTEKLISISLKDADLKTFTKTIERETGLSFIYGEEVTTDKPIHIEVENSTLKHILEQVLSPLQITYKIMGSHILLFRKPTPTSKQRYTISGHIIDNRSSETLIGTHVIENNSQRGTVSNSYGFYSITLPEGQTELIFSYMGYTTQKHTFDLTKDMVCNVRMEDNNQLQEIVVLSDKIETGIQATHMGSHDIPMAQIKNTPSLLGETDVMKTIQLMPGVQAGTDGSSGLYVRGGNADQNLILLDGVPIYNADHLLGFFSVFTPEAIKKVTLFKSSFPARFGGRLSSVVDVRTNDGDMQKYHGMVSIGLLTSKLQFEGPIVKDRTSFHITARRSYIDLLTRPFMSKSNDFGYSMFDTHVKLNHRFSDRSRFFLSFYSGKDNFIYKSEEDYYGYEWDSYDKDKSHLRWGNTVVSGRWNYIFNNRLFSNTTLAYNKYGFDLDAKSESRSTSTGTNYQNRYDSRYRSGISDLSYQVDFDYYPHPRHHVKFGSGYLYHSFRPETETYRQIEKDNDKIEEDVFKNSDNAMIYAHEASVYLEDNFKVSERFSLNPGVHLSLFHVQQKSYYSIQPRLSARYQVTSNIAVKAAYTQMRQYIHLLTNSQLSLPMDLWVPVTENIKPMHSNQYSTGIYYTGIRHWELSAEAYFKDMHNVLEYKDGVSFLGTSTDWEKKVEMGKGRAAGLELMIQKKAGATTGWLAYTLSRSDRKFAEGGINQGKRFPYTYDRRHMVNLTLNHAFSDRIDIGATWTFATGGTLTIAEETTAIIRPPGETNNYYYTNAPGFFWGWSHENKNQNHIHQEGYIEHRNNFRIPSSHTLNVGINFHKKTKHGIRTWNVSVYNVYNTMNPSLVYKKTHLHWNGERVDQYSKIKKITLLPFLPSFSYTYKF